MSIFELGRIGKGNIVTDQAGQDRSGCRRNGAMAAWIFGEGGRLQERSPFGVNRLVDDRFGPDGLGAVLLVPTSQKTIG